MFNKKFNKIFFNKVNIFNNIKFVFKICKRNKDNRDI